jgi:hypothetical protein
MKPVSAILRTRNTAIRLVEDQYFSLKRPFEACTGVFTATTGLPCGHRVQEAKELGISFLPEDFHLHWYWERYTAPSEPILQPLRVVSYVSSNRSHSTRRLPSGFEATEVRQRLCTLVASLAIQGLAFTAQGIYRESFKIMTATPACYLNYTSSIPIKPCFRGYSHGGYRNPV